MSGRGRWPGPSAPSPAPRSRSPGRSTPGRCPDQVLLVAIHRFLPADFQRRVARDRRGITPTRWTAVTCRRRPSDRTGRALETYRTDLRRDRHTRSGRSWSHTTQMTQRRSGDYCSPVRWIDDIRRSRAQSCPSCTGRVFAAAAGLVGHGGRRTRRRRSGERRSASRPARTCVTVPTVTASGTIEDPAEASFSCSATGHQQ